MTKAEIVNKILWVQEEIVYEECAELHYNFRRVAELKKQLKKLEKKLAELN